LPGGAADQAIVRRNGLKEALPACAQIHVEAGEMIVAVSCGGGGYGAPTDRPPEAVGDDVREGLISTGRARSIYGVVLDADSRVDPEATEQCRASMRGAA
jgi:N-methylhydantoinase B